MITRKQESEVNTMSTRSRGGRTRFGVAAPLAVAVARTVNRRR